MKIEEFSTPILCDTNKDGRIAKEWFIFFTVTINGEKIERKRREGINRIKDLKQRRIEGEALAKARYEWLKAGWNPITDPKFQLRNLQQSTETTSEGQASKLPLPGALQWALNKKRLAKKSKLGYQSQLDAIVASINRLGYTNLPVTEFKRFHVKSILEQLAEDKEEDFKKDLHSNKKRKARKLSNHGYNKYRDTIRTLCTELLEWEIIEYNPAIRITSKVVAESNMYAPLTTNEKRIVAEYLFKNHFRYLVCLMVIYHTGIRPKETLALKIPDIDLTSRTITIVPNLEEENAKTPKIRKVPICDELLDFLNELELHRYPADYYVFGSPFGIEGNRGCFEGKRGAKRPDYFLPSPNRVKRDTITNLWKHIVMEVLGIDKHQYAMKHTGADDKILAGVDLDALRALYGHSSKRMTEKYTKEIKNVYKKEIIEKSPSLTGRSLLR